jgi:hypothetical protein
MKTVYENLLKIPEIPVEVMESLERAEIINADNVAEFYWRGSSQEEWFLNDDFPNVAPPFPDFFIEYRVPRYSNSEGVTKEMLPAGTNMRIGILLHATEYDEPEFLSFGLRWNLQATLFNEINGNIYLYPQGPYLCSWQIGICGDGLVGHIGKDFFVTLQVPIKFLESFPEINVKDNFFRAPLDVCLLTISFLHCKNVELIERGPGISKNYKRNRHKSNVRYHVLAIEPMKKVLRMEGQSESTGIKRALHICRGHFKDFSKGHGLFGRYTGIYWWNSQVRGSLSEGIVNKDYSISL